MHDPRVAVIEVQVDEVRYWLSTENALTKIVNLSAATITGRAAAPGELRWLSKDEVWSLSYITITLLILPCRADCSSPRHPGKEALKLSVVDADISMTSRSLYRGGNIEYHDMIATFCQPLVRRSQ